MPPSPETQSYYAHKGLHRPNTMQVVLGLDAEDPGQILLFKAYRDNAAYPFRLLFPEGGGRRQWLALVLSLDEVFDAANQVMRIQVDLHPVSEIERD